MVIAMVTLGALPLEYRQKINPLTPNIKEQILLSCPYAFLIKVLRGNSKINPLSPNSDQYQISLFNINAYSTPEVMGIKDMITQGEFS